MTAYDYKSQEWHDGPEGHVLLHEQIRETLALLRGPTGAQYAEFIALPPASIPEFIAHLERQLPPNTVSTTAAGLSSPASPVFIGSAPSS